MSQSQPSCFESGSLSLLLSVTLLLAPAISFAATTEDVYKDTCAICHGVDGAGQTARGKRFKLKDLRSAEIQKLTDAQLLDIIAKGKGKDMPGYEQEFGPDGVKAQVAHLRELAKKK